MHGVFDQKSEILKRASFLLFSTKWEDSFLYFIFSTKWEDFGGDGGNHF